MVFDIYPVAFSVGPFPVRWYSLSYIFGAVFFYYSTVFVYRKFFYSRLKVEEIDSLLFSTVLGVLIGGRLGYMLIYNLPYYIQDPFTNFYDMARRHVVSRRFLGMCTGDVCSF